MDWNLSSIICICSAEYFFAVSAKLSAKSSSSESRWVLIPVLLSEIALVKVSLPSTQVYSIESRPMSALQVILSPRAILFIDARTRHAPVPTESIMKPILPTSVAFSFSGASIAGVLDSPSTMLCQSMVMCCFLNLLIITSP